MNNIRSNLILINEFNFDINVHSKKSFNDFYEYLNNYQPEMFKRIEKCFKKFDDDIIIDKLELNLSNFNLSNFFFLFESELLSQLKKVKTINTDTINSLDFFLSNGYFPWWAEKKKIPITHSFKFEDSEYKSHLRFINQFSSEDFNQYLKFIFGQSKYLIFNDLYYLFNSVLGKYYFNTRFNYTKKFFFNDFYYTFSKKINKKEIIEFIEQFSTKYNIPSNEIILYFIIQLNSDSNINKIHSRIFLNNILKSFKDNDSAILKFTFNNQSKILVYQKFFNDNFMVNIKTYDSFKYIYNKEYISDIFKSKIDLTNHSLYQLSDYTTTENFLIHFLDNRYSHEEISIIFLFKEILKKSNLIGFFDKLSMSSNISNFHIVSFFKHIINFKTNVKIDFLIESFLKKIAVIYKVDFHYFLLDFKLSLNLNEIDNVLKKVLLKIFNRNLFYKHFNILKRNNLLAAKDSLTETEIDDIKEGYVSNEVYKVEKFGNSFILIDPAGVIVGTLDVNTSLRKTAFNQGMAVQAHIGKNGKKSYRKVDMNIYNSLVIINNQKSGVQSQEKGDYITIEDSKYRTVISNSKQNEFRNLLFEIFNLFKSNSKFKEFFRSKNDLLIFIDNQISFSKNIIDYSFFLNTINVFSSIISVPNSIIFINYLKYIPKKTSFSDYELNIIEKTTYELLINNSQISPVIQDQLIFNNSIDFVISLISKKSFIEVNKYEKLFYIPYLTDHISEKTMYYVIAKITQGNKTNYSEIYNELVKSLRFQKLKEYESRIKFFTIKILIERKNNLSKSLFIKSLFKSFVISDKISSFTFSKTHSINDITKYLNNIDSKAFNQTSNEKIFKTDQSVKNIFNIVKSLNFLTKNSFNSNNFEFLLNIKNEIKKNNNELLFFEYDFHNNITEILSDKESLIKFLELNFYDQELFFSFVELSLIDEFNVQINDILTKDDKKFSIYEYLFIAIFERFNIANLDRNAYQVLLRSYLLKTIIADKYYKFTYSDFFIGFFYYLFNSSKLNLKNLSKVKSINDINFLQSKKNVQKVKSLDNNSSLKSRKSISKVDYSQVLNFFKSKKNISKKEKSLIFQELLYSLNLFLDYNNLSGITKTQKEKIYYRDLSFYLISKKDKPFWNRTSEFNVADALTIFDKLILSGEGFDFDYIFFDKKLLYNIMIHSRAKDFFYQRTIMNLILISIKNTKTYNFKKFFKKLEKIKDFYKFFETLTNLVNEESSKFEIINKIDKYYIISYYIEFGSIESINVYKDKKELYIDFMSLYKKDSVKVKKLIYNSANNKDNIQRLVSIFPKNDKRKYLDIIHPKLNNQVKFLFDLLNKVFSESFLKKLKLYEKDYLFVYISYLWSKSNFIIYDIEKIIIDLINNIIYKSEIREKDFYKRIISKSNNINKNEKLFLDKISIKKELIYKPKLKIQQDKPKVKPNDNFESIIINNAGLILLWPYMYTLCDKLGFLENKTFINDLYRQKAILLTQYIVSGSLEFKEDELILNKIFFGVELDFLIDCSIELLDHELDMCESLLKSVISYWKKMENTTVDTFRNSFLMREGALIKDDKNYVLHVNKNPYDVLLKTLPWSIANVQTIFMKFKIIVNWN